LPLFDHFSAVPRPLMLEDHYKFALYQEAIHGDPDKRGTARRKLKVLRQTGTILAYFARFQQYIACHGTISNVAYLWQSWSMRNQMNSTSRTLKHGGVKQWFARLCLTSPTLPLVDKLKRTGVTREGYEARGAAGVCRRTGQDAGEQWTRRYKAVQVS
jgi:hypothetical protein